MTSALGGNEIEDLAPNAASDEPQQPGQIHPLEIAALSPAEVYAELGTRVEGLSPPEAAQRLQQSGPNRIEKVKGKPLWLRFLANFYHLFAIMLWIAGVLAFVGGMPELGWAIFAVILINAIFSFWQEFRAEKATEALEKLIPQQALVMRDGEALKIDVADVVPGDVLMLEEGDNVSADARLIECYDLQVNQATLNGESQPSRRVSTAIADPGGTATDMRNLVFAGTAVAYGRGRAVVFSTGMNTQFGNIAGLTQSVSDSLSPIQRQMESITRLVAFMATGLGVLFFILGYFVAGQGLAEGFLFAVGIIVANVPEGLLPTVTLALAMGVQRMADRNALVKKLSAVETLGSTTVICTDKTGTLTQNEMTVRQAFLPDLEIEVGGIGYEPVGDIITDGSPLDSEQSTRVADLMRGAALCSNARLHAPDDSHPGWAIIGDPTEGALLVAAPKAGLELDAEMAALPRTAELPFDSTRKRMSTLHSSGGRTIAYVKGAPKELLALCTSANTPSGTVAMTEEISSAALDKNDEYARSGLRVLAVATRDIEPGTPQEIDAIERDLTFLGLIAMMDPPRPEVEDVVRQCNTAGIRIIMITGDYGLTAESIARRIGIIKGLNPRIVTGEELAAMDEAQLESALSEPEVLFARVAPEHKMEIAEALRAQGNIVAMTGDGVNDAPALKAADIGISMGISGTDVAREASDMVLADDNFASIVHAVEEGRGVFDNIRRFVTYIFTSNVPEIVPFILFVMFGIPLPLTIIQILAIDLGTDIVPALALGTERPEPGVMERAPRDQGEKLLNPRVLLRAYLFLGPIQTTACMFAYFYAYWSTGWRPGMPMADSGYVYALATTMTFGAIVWTQIGNGLAQRTTKRSVFSVGLLSNRLLLIGFASEIALLAVLVYVPFLRNVFGFAPLRPTDWILLAALAPTLFIADEIRKFIVRRLDKREPRGRAYREVKGQSSPARLEPS